MAYNAIRDNGLSQRGANFFGIKQQRCDRKPCGVGVGAMFAAAFNRVHALQALLRQTECFELIARQKIGRVG
jgi:proline racemase